MQLIGFMDSPFVRRTAITAQFLGVSYEHKELSVFRDYDEFRRIQPMVKVPTLITGDGARLTDSNLIIRYLESLSARPDILSVPEARRSADLQCTGAALVAMEKAAQIIYETTQRPSERCHQPWVDRLQQQLSAALAEVDAFAEKAVTWMFGDSPSQADVSAAVVWGFLNNSVPTYFDAARFEALARLSEEAEQLPQFAACSYT